MLPAVIVLSGGKVVVGSNIPVRRARLLWPVIFLSGGQDCCGAIALAPVSIQEFGCEFCCLALCISFLSFSSELEGNYKLPS